MQTTRKHLQFSHPICSVNGKRYKYGFNGKEKDNETYGEGNAYDFGARIYDSRLGRWLSLDPLYFKTPHLSPFVFCSNSTIHLLDPTGMLEKDPNGNIIARYLYPQDNEGYFNVNTVIGDSYGIRIGNQQMHTTYTAIYKLVVIKTNNGREVTCKLLDHYIINNEEITYDNNGNVLTRKIISVEKKKELDEGVNFDASSNCHGYTLANGNLWIDDPSMVYEDDYSIVDSEDNGIALRIEANTATEGGNSIDKNAHSILLNGYGYCDSKSGSTLVNENVLTKSEVAKWDFSKLIYYKKKNDVTKTTNGTGDTSTSPGLNLNPTTSQ